MQSPWGEIEIADAHVHFFSHGFFAALAAQRAAQGPAERRAEMAENIAAILGWQAPPAAPEALAAIWVKELDRHGVRRAALIASIPGDEQSVAAAARAYPDRFYGYFMANPVVPDAAERVRTALDGGHLHGICLFPAMHRFSIQENRFGEVLRYRPQTRGTVWLDHAAS